jgi:uncharacterized coiled-coil DUF342 family protein
VTIDGVTWVRDQYWADRYDKADADISALRAERDGLASDFSYLTTELGKARAERDALRTRVAELEAKLVNESDRSTARSGHGETK